MQCGCGNEIHPEREEFLKEAGKALTCTRCSTERPKLTLNIQGHKTGAHLIVIPNDPEQQRLAWRAHRRSR